MSALNNIDDNQERSPEEVVDNNDDDQGIIDDPIVHSEESVDEPIEPLNFAFREPEEIQDQIESPNFEEEQTESSEYGVENGSVTSEDYVSAPEFAYSRTISPEFLDDLEENSLQLSLDSSNENIAEIDMNEEAAPIMNESFYESSPPEDDEPTVEEQETPPVNQPSTQNVSTILHDFNISPESPETSLENSELSSDEQAMFEHRDVSPEGTATFDPTKRKISELIEPVDETEIEASVDGLNSEKSTEIEYILEEDSIDEDIEDDVSEPKEDVEQISEEETFKPEDGLDAQQYVEMISKEDSSSSEHDIEVKNPIELMTEDEETGQSKETVEMMSEEETLEAKETMDLMSEEEDILEAKETMEVLSEEETLEAKETMELVSESSIELSGDESSNPIDTFPQPSIIKPKSSKPLEISETEIIDPTNNDPKETLSKANDDMEAENDGMESVKNSNTTLQAECEEIGDKDIEMEDTVNKTVSDQNPGVFVESESAQDSCEISAETSPEKGEPELPARRTRSRKPIVSPIKERPPVGVKGKDILDSLPVLEKLRALSRAGSMKDDASIGGNLSEIGDAVSVTDSVVSNLQPKRRKIEKKKPIGKNTKGKGKPNRQLSTRSNKGKGRRTIFKKVPMKAVAAIPTVVTSQKIYYKGEFYQVGDIVSVTDLEGDIFYAQLRGFLTDQYGEKSGVITWLLPSTSSPPPNEGFHAATYTIGPEEELPRSMEVFTFVMHAPDDYYHYKNAPYKTNTRCKDSNFTNLRLGPRLRQTIDNKDVYIGI